jgi:hypothetical protein
MAILSVDEITGATSSVNDKGETEYTRLFRVVTSSPLVANLAVRTAAKIPKIGDVYATTTEFDATSLCRRVQPQQDSEAPRVWEVRVEYGPPEAESGQQNPNPLLRSAVVAWGFTQASRPVWKDKDGKPIQNSAGDWYDPPPEIDDSRPVLTVSRNEPAFNSSIAIAYQDAINSDSFMGFSPGQAKVAGISATSQTENNFFFWSVTYEFHFRRDGWQVSILDAGRNYKTQDGNLAPIPQLGVKEDGTTFPMKNTAVPEPIPLDGAGLPIRSPNPSNVKYRDFKVYRELPFANLGVP